MAAVTLSGNDFCVRDWLVRPRLGRIERGTETIHVTPRSMAVLVYLAEASGRVVSRNELLDALWPRMAVTPDALSQCLVELRKAFRDDSRRAAIIETIPKVGIRLVASAAVPEPHPVPELPETNVATSALPSSPSTLTPVSSSRTRTAEDLPTLVPIPTPVPLPRRRWSGVYWALAVTAGIAAVALTGYELWRARSATGVTSVRAEAPSGAELPARTVAVLPFENLSAEPNDAFLATGIAETVLHRLAGVQSLAVIARTSSFTFRDRKVNVRDIGRQLNARYLIEGSVQRDGERLRVTTQLLDASSGSDLWSLRFDRRIGDIFQLQDEISAKVADALAVSLGTVAGTSASRQTQSLDAYLAYLEGRALLYSYKIADTEAGIERLRRATAIDPGFAAAYAQQARGLSLLHALTSRHTSATHDAQAVALIDKALSLDPQLGEAWVERAMVRAHRVAGFDTTTDAEFRKGLALVPNYAQGHMLYGEWLDKVGRTDDGLAMIERARQLDPLEPRPHYVKGLILWLKRGDSDQAEALYLEALRVDPKYQAALTRLGLLQKQRGNFSEGAKLMERAITAEPRAEWMRELAALVYLDLGDITAARDVVSSLSPQHSIQVCIANYTGETPRAAGLAYALTGPDREAAILEFPGCAAAAIRDDALSRHDYDRALRTLQVCVARDWALDANSGIDGVSRLRCVPRYASILIAKGERDRAVKMLHALLTAMEGHGMFMGVRAEALALLGDTEGALAALETHLANTKGFSSYYLDAVEFQGLHEDPRFQSMQLQLHDNAARQATLVAAMRDAGDLPFRSGTAIQ